MTEQKENPKRSEDRAPQPNPAMITQHDESYKPNNSQKGRRLF